MPNQTMTLDEADNLPSEHRFEPPVPVTGRDSAAIIASFAELPIEEALATVRCGLEFEFHKLDGERGVGNNSSEIDSDRLSEASLVAWEEQSITDQFDGNESDEAQLILTLDSMGFPTASQPPEIRNRLQRCYDRAMNAWRDDWEDYERENNYEEWADNSTTFADALSPSETVSRQEIRDVARYTELGEDGSVDGGEIRTQGPCTTAEFLAAAKVISVQNFGVAENCSFHIHLSVPGVQHTYGGKFQAEMYAYLLSQWDRLPKGVQDRIHHDDGGKHWAKFLVKNESKYVAIYKHGFNTWEFRLFGNILKYEEMKVCLELAVEALQWAYKVKLGSAVSLLKRKSLTTIQELLYTCANYNRYEWFPKLLAGATIGELEREAA